MGWEQVITIHSSLSNRGWVLLSHTVGLEQHDSGAQIIAYCVSPSHTVGLEWWEYRTPPASIYASPSHTVGLELAGLLASM